MDRKPQNRYINPLTDYGFKKIFGDKEVMMAFLTDLLQPKVPIENITFLDKELDGMSEYDRGVVYDLLCKTTDGSEFIVEMQNRSQNHFSDRILFYLSRSFSNQEEKGDLEYRRSQLKRLQEEVVDLEDMTSGVSIMDLGLNEFRMDLLAYMKIHGDIDHTPFGIHAVVKGEKPGVIFVLKNVNKDVNIENQNRLHPFYLVYVGNDGEVIANHLQPKDTLDVMRHLARGKAVPDKTLCDRFNKATNNGRNMEKVSHLLEDSIMSIIDAKDESDIDSFFGSGQTTFLSGGFSGLDDFELICFMVVL